MADGAQERITEQVLAWEGVESGPGRFNSTVFSLDGQELGHLHGDGQADIPLPLELHDELIAAGRAEEHRYAPAGSGFVAKPIRSDADVADVVELLRGNYERAQAREPQA